MERTARIRWAVWAALLCLILAPAAAGAAGSSALDRAAQELASQLNQQLPLSGRVIKVSDNLFWEQRTRVNLPFSSPLRDALATALARYGARVSLQEIGPEPLVMTGDYEIFRSDVTITVEIRRMGESASKALAMARTHLDMKSLPRAWFRPEFSRIAKTLIRYLDENYHGVEKFAVEIELPKPGLPGQPPLVLGRYLKKHLEEAVASSLWFIPKGAEEGGRASDILPAVLETTYSQVGNGYLINLQIKNQKGAVMTAAQLSVDRKDIPKDLLEPLNEKGVAVAVVYRQPGLGGVPTSHPAAQAVVSSLRESLAGHGVKVMEATGSTAGASIVVYVGLSAGKSRTYNGLIAFTATARFEVRDVKSGRVIATLSRSGRLVGPGGAYGSTAILTKLANDLGAKGGKALVGPILGRT